MVLDISNSLYAKRRKALISLVNELRTAGAQDDLDLPSIAVIGSQSSGKSSIVESISGITMPRDSGICTRCPIECRLRVANASSSWTCRISLRRGVAPSSNQVLLIPNEIAFGNTITDPSQVEPALRRAQLAALVPRLPLSEVATATDEKLEIWMQEATTRSGAAFTRDTVCIDICGPDVTDLVFIDLPGLIQYAPPHMVQFVQEITMSYIRGRCLILVALPMTDDIENQKALHLARQVDPEGLRTIGVLTKPDMLATGCTKSLENWIQILEGGRHSLVHGYYCTRQLNDSERLQALSPEKSRAIEEDYFKTTSPWPNSAVQERLGMTNLVDSLGHLLMTSIQASLPSVYKTAKKLMEDCQSQLSSLPQPLLRNGEEPAACILRLITELNQDVQEHVWGGNTFPTSLNIGVARSSSARTKELCNTEAPRRHSTAKFIQEHQHLYSKFAKRIRATAPNFVPWEDGWIVQSNLLTSLEGKEGDGETTSGSGDRFTLTKMRQHIQSWTTRELPNNVPFSAKVALIAAFQASWPGAMRSCLDDVKLTTLAVLNERMDQRFGQCPLLKETMRSYILQLMENCYHSCTDLLQIELEKERFPFTQDTHYLEAEKDKWLAKYREARSKLLRETSSVSPFGSFRAVNAAFAQQNGSAEKSDDAPSSSQVASSLPQDNPARSGTRSAPSSFGSSNTMPVQDTSSQANSRSAPTHSFDFSPSQDNTRHNDSDSAPPFSFAKQEDSTRNDVYVTSTPSFSFVGPLMPKVGDFNSTVREYAGGQSSVHSASPSSSVRPLNDGVGDFNLTARDYVGGRWSVHSPSSSSSNRSRKESRNKSTTPSPTSADGTVGSIHVQIPQNPFGGFPPTNSTPTSSAAPRESQATVATKDEVEYQCMPWARASGPACQSFEEARVDSYLVKTQAKKQAKLEDALTVLAELGYDGLMREFLHKLAAPPDAFETEIKVMAEVRGYFQVAYRRIIDNVPNDIDVAFVRAIAQQLQGFLIAKFSFGTANVANETCAEYLLEDPIAAKKRSELVARQKKLSMVLRELESFGPVV